MNKEIWEYIEGYSKKYQISNCGNVKSLDRIVNNRFRKGKILRQSNRCGYLCVALYNGQSKDIVNVHRLVAKAFIENKNDYPVVHHKDSNRSNNHVDNLEWVTTKTNIRSALSKRVIAKNKIGNIIHHYSALIDVVGDGYSYGNVSACCRGLRKTHKGLVWNYE